MIKLADFPSLMQKIGFPFAYHDFRSKEDMPDYPYCVWYCSGSDNFGADMKGHVGIYAGKGEVIEARGHEYGVVVTKLSERPWKNWGKCPFIEYDQKTTITVKKGTWNVRSGPGVSFKSIAVVKGGNVISLSSTTP